MPPAEKRTGSTRFDPSWLLLIAAALLLARVAWGVWESYNPPKREEKVAWVEFERAEALARASGRPILYDFTAEWCPPCNAMKSELFSDPKHARVIANIVVPVRVLDRQREEGRNAAWVDSLQKAYAVDGFPTLVVYSPKTGRSQRSIGFGGNEATLRWMSQSAYAVQSGVAPDGTRVP
jgi:thiol:disulfide interchange protein